jgi:hypothetical protein
MKPYQRYTSLVAAAALALTGSLQAQNSGSTTPAAGSSSMNSPSLDNISRVSKSAVKHQFTAKDLIGAAVYDRAGEKIGDITDLAYGGAFPASLSNAYNLNRNEPDAKDATRMPGASTAPGSYTPTTPSPSTTDRSSTRSGPDRMSSTAPMTNTMASASDVRVFISVGGLWGIGDDLVSVRASELSFNAAEDRFELAASKADVVALAEQDEAPGYASGSSPTDATRAGKQQFADEAAKVRNALEVDTLTSSYAYKVTVTSDGDDIQLRGTVDTEEQHQQILKTARAATTNDVEDENQVRR